VLVFLASQARSIALSLSILAIEFIAQKTDYVANLAMVLLDIRKTTL
jgi:hypothetical protein